MPLTANKDALEVYYVDLHIRDVGAKDKVRSFRYITSVVPNENNVEQMWPVDARVGKLRMKRLTY